MTQSNITQLNCVPLKLNGKDITLDSVQAVIKAWRETKKTASEKIPAELWDQILRLLETAPESKTLGALKISRAQFAAEKLRRQTQAGQANHGISTANHIKEINFCEAQKPKPEPATPLVYKPAESFSTTTSVVELYRPDGGLMKIHICTERFSELLSAFFKV